jgi:hypothetical protein
MRTAVVAVLLLLLLPVGSAQAAEAPTTDVRVLIDISGSMRENDPKNLRRPALRMLVGLMQPGTQAGVWTFARWVNMLVPHGDVDAAWKKRALSLSEQIGSPGQFTNIEEVLVRATRSWEGSAPTAQRHLVLLTDGMVDVSREPGESEASRARILDELMPALKTAQVRVHAIALSERADHALLEGLATATDGWYQKVESAEELQRVFLHIFEKVGQPDSVPLKGNRFQVDKSISEATVLAFRSEGAPPSRLHAPDGSVHEGSDIAAGIAWHNDQGYDLITIADPQAGEWRLEAEEDPDNRVMIVTDLKLETSEMPNRLALGETIPFTAHLANKGETVRRKAFLDLVAWRADEGGEAGGNALSLNDSGEQGDERAGDGRFSTVVGRGAAEGSLELVVAAESATFVREKRFLIDIASPAVLAAVAGDAGVVAEVTVDRELLADIQGVALWQDLAAGGRQPLEGRPQGDGRWVATLADPAAPIMARVEGMTRAGNLVANDFGPVYPPGVTPPPPPPEPVVEPVPEPVVAAPPVEPEPAAAEPVAEEAGGQDWLLPAAVFGGVNLLLVGGGLAWWLLARRRRDTDDLVLVDDEPAPGAGEKPPVGDAATDITREDAA